MNDQSSSTEAVATQTLAIDGITFTAPAPYAEGHTLSVAEANVLNQVFAENLRNNFRKRVADSKEKAKKEGHESLPQDVLDSLIADFTKYANDYEFAGKRQSRGPVDPVEREAMKLAREKLNEAFKLKNIDKKTLAEGQFDKMVAELLEKKPEFRELAKQRLASLQALAADILG
jgi:hypothetical protein